MSFTSNKILLSDIISTDFLFITKANKNLLEVLDFCEINRNLKQFIKILLFIKQNENSKVYILSKNKFIYHFVKKYLLRFFNFSKIVVLDDFSTFKQSNSILTCSLVVSLENLNENNKTLSKILENDLFLIYNIGLNIKSSSSGIYIMKNNLEDYKKIVFLLVILTQILNKN